LLLEGNTQKDSPKPEREQNSAGGDLPVMGYMEMEPGICVLSLGARTRTLQDSRGAPQFSLASRELWLGHEPPG
jgi:hypothetical protein